MFTVEAIRETTMWAQCYLF